MSWTRVDKDARHRSCIDMLKRLRIVRRGEGSVYGMHEGFQRHVQIALAGARVSGGACVEDLPEQDVVDAYAWEQWEVCYYMIRLCCGLRLMHRCIAESLDVCNWDRRRDDGRWHFWPRWGRGA